MGSGTALFSDALDWLRNGDSRSVERSHENAQDGASQHLTTDPDPNQSEDDKSPVESTPRWLQEEDRGRGHTVLYIVLGLIGALVVAAIVTASFHDRLGFELPFLDTTSKEAQDAAPQNIGDQAGPNGRKALVVSSYQNQGVEWMEEVNRPNTTTKWELYRYVNDAPQESEALKVDNPNGREALAYLTFIIDNYHNLPDHMVFVHGHVRAWHQPTPIEYKLWSLNLTALDDEGYFNIRCQSRGCTEESMYYYDGQYPDDSRTASHDLFRVFWKEMMQKDYGPLPYRIGRTCCAQFAASKRVILAHPLSFWKHYREPLLDGHKKKYKFRRNASLYKAGLFYEHVWHIVMGAGTESCPGDDKCNQIYFGNHISCDRIPTWATHDGWENIKCEFDWFFKNDKFHGEDSSNSTTSR